MEGPEFRLFRAENENCVAGFVVDPMTQAVVRCAPILYKKIHGRELSWVRHELELLGWTVTEIAR